ILQRIRDVLGKQSLRSPEKRSRHHVSTPIVIARECISAGRECRMRAVVTGMIATYPVGGVAWDYGQYAAGLERLGFEVYYLEDTGGQTYDPVKREYSDDCTYGVRYLKKSLARLSPHLGERSHFRDVS